VPRIISSAFSRFSDPAPENEMSRAYIACSFHQGSARSYDESDPGWDIALRPDLHRCSSQPGHAAISRGSQGHLAGGGPRRHAHRVDEEEGIYRGEVLELMGAVADIRVDVRRILWCIEGDDDEWKRRKRKRIPPETLERLMAEDENYQALRRSVERLKIELATGKRPPPDFRPST
jgi:hypothetical protein